MDLQKLLVDYDLDFNISKRPLVDMDNNPSGYFGLFNDKINKCINTVKSSYHVVQNEEIVDLMLKGIKPFEGELKVTKGGILNEGRKIFLQLGIEGDGIMGNDRIKRYVTLIDSNDGSTSLCVGVGDLTMSCSNQFFKFYKEGQHKFRHTVSIQEKIKQLPFLIENSLEQSLKRIELYKKFAATSIHKELAHQLVNEMMGYDRVSTSEEDFRKLSTRGLNTMNNLYDCLDIEMKSKGETGWGLFSGITRYTTHHKSKMNRANGDVESLMFGDTYKMNQKALEFVSDLVMS